MIPKPHLRMLKDLEVSKPKLKVFFKGKNGPTIVMTSVNRFFG
jgi:hypothetical protein